VDEKAGGCIPSASASYSTNHFFTEEATMKSKLGMFVGLMLLSTTALMYAQVGTDLKDAAKDTGHATKTAADKTGHATEKAADKTGDATKTAAKKTAHGVKKGAKATAHGTKKAADKTADAVK